MNEKRLHAKHFLQQHMQVRYNYFLLPGATVRPLKTLRHCFKKSLSGAFDLPILTKTQRGSVTMRGKRAVVGTYVRDKTT